MSFWTEIYHLHENVYVDSDNYGLPVCAPFAS